MYSAIEMIFTIIKLIEKLKTFENPESNRSDQVKLGNKIVPKALK